MAPTMKRTPPSRKLKNPRTEALARMGKPELLKTIRTLDARVTKLLNEIEGRRETEEVLRKTVNRLQTVERDAKPLLELKQSMVRQRHPLEPADARLPYVSPVAELESDMRAGLDNGKFPWET